MTTLAELGWDDARAAEIVGRDGEPGRVVRQDRGWVQVAIDGEIISAKTRADRVGTPVPGDFVLVHDGEVSAVLERRTMLRRLDPIGEGAQVLAANIDRVLVVAGLDRPVKAGRVQRALAQAWDADAEPMIVLTKADVVEDLAGSIAGVVDEHPGTEVFAVSARTGAGLEEIRAALGSDTVVMLGESGAGKSSLLNALAGSEVAQTGAVRDHDAKGRHTTTRRELHLLVGGAVVIDTPGVRAIGVLAEPESVDAAFPDIRDLTEQCRFSNCAHDTEPGCAVKAAIESGELAVERFEAFCDLHEEARRGVAAIPVSRPRRGPRRRR